MTVNDEGRSGPEVGPTGCDGIVGPALRTVVLTERLDLGDEITGLALPCLVGVKSCVDQDGIPFPDVYVIAHGL